MDTKKGVVAAAALVAVGAVEFMGFSLSTHSHDDVAHSHPSEAVPSLSVIIVGDENGYVKSGYFDGGTLTLVREPVPTFIEGN